MITEVAERVDYIESITTRPITYRGGYFHHVLTGRVGVYGFKSNSSECAIAKGQTWLMRYWINGPYNNLFIAECERLGL